MASNATLSIDKTTLSFEKDGSSQSIAVTSNIGWSVYNTADWITLDRSDGTGNGTVNVTATANTTTAQRTATITVTGGALTRQVSVTQDAGDATLSIDITTLSFEKDGGGENIVVTSNTTWSVSANADWVSLSPANTGNGDGLIHVYVPYNPTLEPRAATVTFTYGDAQTRTIAITQDAGDPSLSIGSVPYFEKTGGNGTFTITSNTAWSMSVDAGWVTLSPTSGNGDGTITITVTEANPTSKSRYATITFTYGDAQTQTRSVGQAAGDPTLSVTPTEVLAEKTGGSYPVAVTSNTTWTVSRNASWVTVSPTSGNGNGTVNVTAAENTTTIIRSATVTVSSGTLTQRVHVEQGAVDPTLSVTPTEIAAAIYSDSNYQIEVTSNSTWTATVNSDATWCTLTKTSGSGNGAATVNVVANPVDASRAATVTFTSGTLTRTVSVTQAAAPLSSACDIVGFTVNDIAWDISGTAITYTYPDGTQATTLTPVITVSAGATVTPASGTARNFFTPQGVAYTVTAENGTTQKTYTAKAFPIVVASGKTGACTWTLTGISPNYTVTISGNGAMANYDRYNDNSPPWFNYRSAIKTVVIQDGVTSISEQAFGYVTGLTNVTIGNSVTTISYGAFDNCTGLTGTLTIPNSVITIGELAFGGCTGLTSVTIGNSVTTIGEHAFLYCTGLTGALTIPNSVKTIGGGAFNACPGLTSVTIGNSVTTIGVGAFGGCHHLTGVTIPNSVTSIGENAFYNCIGLTRMTIGSSVETIGENAFWGCTGLTTVTNLSTTPQSIGNEAFHTNSYNGTLKVPSSAVNAYKVATGWGKFKTITGI
jgi:hypothetical protein